jgi:hypothetical protein
VLYHHTDSAHLPWILNDAALKPATGTSVGIYPDPDFLWATTDPLGDPTTTTSFKDGREAYRNGKIAAVRFTLFEDDFMAWPAIRELYPQWTPELCALLERNVSPSVVAKWRCRVSALPEERWERIEYRTWSRPAWRRLEDRTVSAGLKLGSLAIRLDGVGYGSTRIAASEQLFHYRVGKEAVS